MIRFYIDGTTGQKDGTEVTSINPITATGLFPSGSTAASKSVKVYIRADAGESYRQVLVGVNADKFTKCRITSFNNSITQTIGLTGGYFETVLKTVSDVNQELTFTIIISAIGTQQSQVRPVLFQDKTALLQALDGSNIYAAISPNNPLAINSTNKITSVNSCLFFIVAIKPGAQVGNLYPQNLLNFSFTETELTS